MTCDGNDALRVEIQRVEQRIFKGEPLLHRGLHGVDGGVAGDKYLSADSLGAQIVRIGAGGREMQLGDVAHQGAVHLLGEGRIFVPGAKARLHMAHGDLMIEGRQCACKGRGGIAVHQDEVRLCLIDHPIHAQDGLRGDGGQGLLPFHNVQVILGLQAEGLHDGIQHLPVLAGEAADALQSLPAAQLHDEGGHLDRLRPGAEDRHDFNLLHVQKSPPVWARFFCVCRQKWCRSR